jgi:hypothetical protein
MTANPDAQDYPLTLRDLQDHFGVVHRTARRYAKKLPRHLVRRKMTFRGEIRFKKEALSCLEDLIKLHRGW